MSEIRKLEDDTKLSEEEERKRREKEKVYLTNYYFDKLQSSSEVKKVGLLEKKGGNRKNWTKRWFILYLDCLFYFKPGPNDSAPSAVAKPMGYIDLGYVKSSLITEYSERNDFVFIIPTPGRTYFLKANTRTKMDKWISVIKNQVTQLESVDKSVITNLTANLRVSQTIFPKNLTLPTQVTVDQALQFIQDMKKYAEGLKTWPAYFQKLKLFSEYYDGELQSYIDFMVHEPSIETRIRQCELSILSDWKQTIVNAVKELEDVSREVRNHKLKEYLQLIEFYKQYQREVHRNSNFELEAEAERLREMLMESS